MPCPSGDRNPVLKQHTSQVKYQEKGVNNIWEDSISSWRTGSRPASGGSKWRVEADWGSFLCFFGKCRQHSRGWSSG